MSGTITGVGLIGDEHELLLPEMKKAPKDGNPGAQVEDEKKALDGPGYRAEAKKGSGRQQERNQGRDAEGDHDEDDCPGQNGAGQHDQEADKDVVAGLLEAQWGHVRQGTAEAGVVGGHPFTEGTGGAIKVLI